jgi:hypothetical protein
MKPPTDLDQALSRLSLTKRRRAIQLLNSIAIPLSQGSTPADIATQHQQTLSWVEERRAELARLLMNPAVDDLSAAWVKTQPELQHLLEQPDPGR